ncbi:MAG: VOC family protein [Acutalibacteraceae bacterium]
MKYICTVISVSDIEAAKKFYKDLFGLKIYQDYGKNIAFTCGLALQQDFDWLVNLPKEKVLKKSNNVEIAFEESDFDEFLIRLKQYENIEYLDEVMEHTWGQRVIRFYDLDVTYHRSRRKYENSNSTFSFNRYDNGRNIK